MPLDLTTPISAQDLRLVLVLAHARSPETLALQQELGGHLCSGGSPSLGPPR